MSDDTPQATPTVDASAHSDADLLRMYLADRDEPCPSCKYNLRGCAAAVCPECGWRIELVLTQRLPIVAWGLGLVGLSAGFGTWLFSLFYNVYLAITLPQYASFGRPWLPVVGVVVLLPCVSFWIYFRTKVCFARRAMQWAAVAACWMLSIGVTILLVVLGPS